MILPYKDPEEARAKSREYGRRPEVKARRKTREKQYNKEYRERPEVKSRMKKYGKEYLQRPEVKARRKELRDRPEVKARRKEHSQLPEVKARKKEYAKKHHQLPEVKASKRQYMKNYVKKHRLELSKKTKERNLKVKEEVLGHYSKKLSNSDVPCCNCCGEHEFLIFLSIDHITDRKNVTHGKGYAGTRMYRYLRRNGYPSGYQVLCINCNSAKSDSGICPHKRSGR